VLVGSNFTPKPNNAQFVVNNCSQELSKKMFVPTTTRAEKLITEPRRHVYVCFGGGDGLKFGDVITAVASLTVVNILLEYAFLEIFAPMTPTGGTAHALISVAGILSTLVASLLIGYVFASKIQEESRWGAIGSIVVLHAVVFMLILVPLMANPFVYPVVKDNLDSMFSTTTTSGWTDYEWFVAAVGVVMFNVVVVLVFSFIGLYLGSMRKPSAKTKE
jgi:hypothetical protein